MIDNPPWFRIRIEGRFWVNVNFSFPEEIINSLKSHADVTGDKEPGVTRLSPWYRRKGEVPSFILDNPIGWPSCSPYVQSYYRNTRRKTYDAS